MAGIGYRSATPILQNTGGENGGAIGSNPTIAQLVAQMQAAGGTPMPGGALPQAGGAMSGTPLQNTVDGVSTAQPQVGAAGGNMSGTPASVNPQLGGGQQIGPPQFQPYGSNPNGAGLAGVGNAGVNATVAPTVPTADYTQEVTQSLQPTFTAQDQQLAENLAGMGVLNSGEANKGFQDLTGEQGAAISSAVAPLIAQGYNNANSNYQLGNQLGEQTSIANQSTQTQYDLANLGALNSQQLAQLGYSNQDYEQLLQDAYGLTTNGQNASNTIAEGSVPYGSQAYQAGENLGATGAAGQGAGSVGAYNPYGGNTNYGQSGVVTGYDPEGYPEYGNGSPSNPYTSSTPGAPGDAGGG